ncbi:Ferric iron ABC transporter permease protein [Lactiplantibacillus plantarum]|nr:hypothetical protein [Lactiplantibacillus plantarum]KZU53959.1 Ferric iron ABC transporter permease protein [Lactiplantibacillus plantarum]
MSNHQIRLSLSIITSCLLATLIIGPLVALIGQTLVGQSPSQLWSQLTQPTNRVSIQHSLFLSGGTVVGTTLLATPLAWIMTHTRLTKLAWLHWLLLVPFMTPPYIRWAGYISFNHTDYWPSLIRVGTTNFSGYFHRSGWSLS